MIGIIDYGLGNIKAFYNIYKEKGINLKIISTYKDISKDIKKIILPGIGSYDSALQLLQKKNFIEPIKNFALISDHKILGICVGMQILAESSEEGKLSGLSLVNEKFVKMKSPVVPHIGWNKITIKKKINLLENIPEDSYFYFLHSYSLENIDSKFKVCETYYGSKFVSIFNKNNIFGIQFHPEKSHEQGSQLLLNFYKS
tara:strand:- start:1779 stop:2378 length:600 start_codon:yes stop_codon:yes gene_type:complete